ncbi:MAG: EAL domain-containing protein [Planctomycetota bacterium]
MSNASSVDGGRQEAAKPRPQSCEESLKRLVSDNPLGVIVSNAAGVVRLANSAASFLLGPEDAVEGQRPRFPLEERAGDLTVFEGGEVTHHVEIRSIPIHWNGEAAWFSVLQDVSKLRGFQERVTDLEKQLSEARQRLERMTRIDSLTELLNWRGFQDALTRELGWARREGADLVVVLLSLDDFQQINDSLGHAAGDVVLVETARKIESSLRETDYCARIGGDEFVILLPRTRLAEAMRVAEKLRLAIAECPISLSNGRVRVTASLGVVPVSQENTVFERLLVQAHELVQISKTAGKNRVSFFADPRKPIADDHGLDRVLAALRRGDCFRVVTHPIVRLSDERPVGVELLSRLSSDDFEMPDDFFRVSREANILTLVDHQCLRSCVEASHLLPPETRRHLNVFPSTMLDVSPSRLIDSFPHERTDGSFCVEISEQQIIGDPSYLAESVSALRGEGIRIAIDDVGFGRSCLESLILLEPDIVKIDKKCVMGFSTDESRIRSLERLLRLSSSLGTEVVAEGIETREDLELLKSMGVNYGQGFLWGRPSAAALA